MSCFLYCEFVLYLLLRPSGKNVATCKRRLMPSGNHTATFAVNHNFLEQILDWSIGVSM